MSIPRFGNQQNSNHKYKSTGNLTSADGLNSRFLLVLIMRMNHVTNLSLAYTIYLSSLIMFCITGHSLLIIHMAIIRI